MIESPGLPLGRPLEPTNPEIGEVNTASEMYQLRVTPFTDRVRRLPGFCTVILLPLNVVLEMA
jgi:hypothetical protein